MERKRFIIGVLVILIFVGWFHCWTLKEDVELVVFHDGEEVRFHSNPNTKDIIYEARVKVVDGDILFCIMYNRQVYRYIENKDIEFYDNHISVENEREAYLLFAKELSAIKDEKFVLEFYDQINLCEIEVEFIWNQVLEMLEYLPKKYEN